MATLSSYLTGIHRECDEFFAQAETAAAKGNWAESADLFDKFSRSMDEHLRTEEEVLFPAFEEASGITAGPTVTMRFEHNQMRGLLGQMLGALKEKNQTDYLSASETMLVLMQQHNMKEEHVLYPMSDMHLEAEVGQLIDRMETYKGG